jgi:hypothetical protein
MFPFSAHAPEKFGPLSNSRLLVMGVSRYGNIQHDL